MSFSRTQQANLQAVPHPIVYAERQAGSREYHFYKVLSMTQPGIEPRFYRSKSGRSNPVVLNL